MNPVIVRNIKLGEGRPKICVPIVSKTTESILAEAKELLTLPIDLVEWRVDWFDDAFDTDKVIKTASELRNILINIPILFTFRTKKEGGEKGITKNVYADLNIKAARSGYIDLIDVEAFTGDDIVTKIIAEAHKVNVKVVASNHDFFKTPSKDEIVSRLCKMKDLGADIPKIAVMPNCKQDVLSLLSATLEMQEKHTDGPIITMSMSRTGVVTRLIGEVFGSALTFGAAKAASAPGQIHVTELEQVLNIIHKNS